MDCLLVESSDERQVTRDGRFPEGIPVGCATHVLNLKGAQEEILLVPGEP